MSPFYFKSFSTFFFFFTCLWFSLKLAGNFGKELEGETSSCLPVTDATFAVACLAALNPVGAKRAVCKERKDYFRLICPTKQAGGED